MNQTLTTEEQKEFDKAMEEIRQSELKEGYLNRNEILCKIQHELAKKIEPIVTEFMHRHPEYFHDCVNSSGLICNCEITLSYQPDNLKEIATVKPCVFTRIGGSEYGEECNRYPHHPEHLCYTTWIGRERTAEYEEDF